MGGRRVKLNFDRAIVCSRAWGVVRLDELPGLLDASWKVWRTQVDKNKCPEWRGRSSYY